MLGDSCNKRQFPTPGCYRNLTKTHKINKTYVENYKQFRDDWKIWQIIRMKFFINQTVNI